MSLKGYFYQTDPVSGERQLMYRKNGRKLFRVERGEDGRRRLVLMAEDVVPKELPKVLGGRKRWYRMQG